MSFALKRIYDQPLAADGLRILVDRIWPRGMTKEEARVELWLKEIALYGAAQMVCPMTLQNGRHFESATSWS